MLSSMPQVKKNTGRRSLVKASHPYVDQLIISGPPQGICWCGLPGVIVKGEERREKKKKGKSTCTLEMNVFVDNTR